MRRRTAHLAFGAIVAGLATFCVYQAIRLHEARQVNAAVAGVNAKGTASTLPEARFVQALAIARSGDNEGALKAYKALARDAPPALAAAALYNAGNLQLRAAMKEGPDAAVRALPLIELSKQSYRAGLRIDPHNWDARYNLERALWLAPEMEETQVDRVRRDAEERVMSTLQSTRADLP
jgi:mxaK protein